MKRFLRGLAILIIAVAVMMAYRQAGVAGPGVQGDACQNPQAPKQNVPLAISTATTTLLVQASTGNAIDVCGFDFTLAGTTPTIKFEYGTQSSSACDTGTTALTGTMAPTSGSYLHAGNFILFAAPAGTQLCAVTTGTGASAQGGVNYVLQ